MVMATKKKSAAKVQDKAGTDEEPDIWTTSTGVNHQGIRMARIREVLSVLWLPDNLSKEEKDKAILAALNMYSELKPQNGIEGMLAAQMVGTHAAAMECLRRAMIPGQSFEGRDQNLKHANKLMQTYSRQLEVLDKHRGKGQQKITVEHVTVEAGGQAIVGNVSTGAGQSSVPKPAQAIVDQSGNEIHVPAPVITEKAKTRRRSKQGQDD